MATRSSLCEHSQRLIDSLKYENHTIKELAGHPLHAMTDVPLTNFVADIQRKTKGSFILIYSAYLKAGDVKPLQAAEEASFLQNKDLISGNTRGYDIMLSMSTANGSLRSTPSEAFISNKPGSLDIKTGLEATRLLFKNRTAK